jgi:hypothetical protein
MLMQQVVQVKLPHDWAELREDVPALAPVHWVQEEAVA